MSRNNNYFVNLLPLSLVHFLLIDTVYFEVYGCQMNINDTEVAWSILKDAGYTKTTDANEVLE